MPEQSPLATHMPSISTSSHRVFSPLSLTRLQAGASGEVTDPALLSDKNHATDLFADAAVAQIQAHDGKQPLFQVGRVSPPRAARWPSSFCLRGCLAGCLLQVLSFTAPHDPLVLDRVKGPEHLARCGGHATLRRRQFCALLAQVSGPHARARPQATICSRRAPMQVFMPRCTAAEEG